MNHDHVDQVDRPISNGKSLVAAAKLDSGPRDRRFGWRLVFVAGTLLAYSVAELLGKALVVLQLVVRAITGAPSVRLVAAGEHLSRYIYNAWRYLCFCVNTPPWPLHRWQHPTTPSRPDDGWRASAGSFHPLRALQASRKPQDGALRDCPKAPGHTAIPSAAIECKASQHGLSTRPKFRLSSGPNSRLSD